MGAKYSHGLGALLNKIVRTRATKETHTTHTQQQPTCAAATHSPVAWPVSLHGKGKITPKSPTGLRRLQAVGVVLVVVGLLAWWGQNERHQKLREGGALALGGRQTMGIQQPSNIWLQY